MTYIDENEYQYLLGRIKQDLEFEREAEARWYDTALSFLSAAGFGWVVAGMRTAGSVWRTVRGLWQRIFG